MTVKYFRIWNRERGQWWRQDEMGYADADHAGVFRADSGAVASARERRHEDALVEYKPTPLELKLMALDSEAR